jgi:5-methylcytosine-specific restriction endonuclease McrA
MTAWWKSYSRKDFIAHLYKLQRGRCACCRRRFGKIGMELDHIIPRASGGTDDPRNMQLLCSPCNRDLFYRARGFLL